MAVTHQPPPTAAPCARCRIDDVIDQLSEADAASFKRCYEVLQQSITGQASPTSILNSSLPKCVTSAITNPPARSKRKKTASGGVQDVGSAPAPAPAAAATAGTAAQPIQVPPHQAGVMPGYSYASSFPPGMYAYPGMVPVSGGMPGHFLHAMQPPTAVMGQDGNLYMAYPRAAFQQAAHVQPVQPKAIPAPHPRMPSQGHSSSSRSSSNASVKLPVSVAAHPAQSTAPPTASAPPQAPPTAESEKKTIGGAKRRRSLPGGLTIATDAELDPRKLANLLPQHTPGGSLIPARRRAHTQLLLGMLSKTAQPTEQSRDAATQQAVRITVHAVPEQAAGADAEDGEDGEEAADDEVPDTDTAEAGAAAPAHATSASTTHPDSHFPPSASLLTYSSLDKAYGRMLSFQRTPGGGIVDVAPQAKVSATPGGSGPPAGSSGLPTPQGDPHTHLHTVASGLLHNASTLVASQTPQALSALGITPRGGLASSTPGLKDGGAFFFAEESAPPQASVMPAPSSQPPSAREREQGGGLGVAPPLAPASALAAAARLSAQRSLEAFTAADDPPGGDGPGPLDLDRDALLDYFSLPPALRTPAGLGALAATSSSAPPGAAFTIVGPTRAVGGGPTPNASAPAAPEPVQPLAQVSSSSSEVLAGTAALLGTHPSLSSLVSPPIRVSASQSVPTTDSAAAPTTSQGGIFTFKADETGGQGGSTVGGSGHAAARPSRAAAHASRLSALLSPTSSGLPVATPRLLTSTSAASGLFFGTTPRDGAGQDGAGAAPMLFDFS